MRFQIDSKWTPEQLEQQSREAVIAYLRDGNVQLEECFKQPSYIGWAKLNDNCFNLDTRYYRIAQPKPWCRVALIRGGATVTVDTDIAERHMETRGLSFVKWITERIEYDY